MKKIINLLIAVLFVIQYPNAQTNSIHNPIVWADIPDISIIRVGEIYYMSSTTMHMNPGTPIMKSTNLVDWEMASYPYEVLDSIDAFELNNNLNVYGKGTWASSLRYHNGVFYVSTFSLSTNSNYLFSIPLIPTKRHGK